MRLPGVLVTPLSASGVPPPRLRRNRLNPKRVKSCEEVFARLKAEGLSSDQLYNAIVDQVCIHLIIAFASQFHQRPSAFVMGLVMGPYVLTRGFSQSIILPATHHSVPSDMAI